MKSVRAHYLSIQEFREKKKTAAFHDAYFQSIQDHRIAAAGLAQPEMRETCWKQNN